MYSSLTEMYASAHRDELRRHASRHSQVRQARRDAARNTPRTSPASFLPFRVAGRPSQTHPAAAA